ncbi:MAG: BLUF domain-containing protein [Pseudomonadota bacterium]
MKLSRLVYYSQRNPSAALDLKQIIQSCHRNNAPMNITGMLHFSGTAFLQVLEGGRAEVSATYHRIAADPRHNNIILISCSDVSERLFPTWSMGLHEGKAKETRDIFLRYFATSEINPESVDVDSLLDVMQDLAAEL